MQKTILGAAIAAICGLGTSAAMAQQASTSKVELWGIADAAIRHTNNEGENKSGLTKMMGGGMSQSRWGINVEEDLGGGSKAIAHLEHRFNLDTGEKTEDDPFFQLAYVGIQGPYGRFTMGRQWNVLFDVVSSTYASFPYSPYMDAYKPELGMAAGARTNNSLKYTLATPDRSWVGTLQYSFGEKNNTKSVQGVGLAALQEKVSPSLQANTSINTNLAPGFTVKDAIDLAVEEAANDPNPNPLKKSVTKVGTGAMKTVGGFLRHASNGYAIGGGYLRTTLPGNSKLDAWTFGGSYRTGPWYFNAGYGVNKFKGKTGSTVAEYINYQTDRQILNEMWAGQTNGGFQSGDANKRQMYKVGFGYQATPQINVGLHYYHAKQSGSIGGASNGKANFMVAVVDYAFSKRTDAYFGIDNTKVSGGSKMFIDNESKARSRTGITVGLRHRF